MNGNKTVLTRKQVAEKIGVSTSTILRLTQDGDLPCFRANFPRGRTYYYLSDVESFLEEQKRKQAEQVEKRKKG